MSELDLADVARDLGMKPTEVLSADETDAGLLVDLFDGTQIILVPDDRPDAEGKTGRMYWVAPKLAGDRVYTGDAPVYAHFASDDAGAGDGEDGDEYPEKGSAAKVLAWVAGDLDRAKEALDREAAGKNRKELTEELDAIVAQYDAAGDAGAGDGEDGDE